MCLQQTGELTPILVSLVSKDSKASMKKTAAKAMKKAAAKGSSMKKRGKSVGAGTAMETAMSHSGSPMRSAVRPYLTEMTKTCQMHAKSTTRRLCCKCHEDSVLNVQQSLFPHR